MPGELVHWCLVPGGSDSALTSFFCEHFFSIYRQWQMIHTQHSNTTHNQPDNQPTINYQQSQQSETPAHAPTCPPPPPPSQVKKLRVFVPLENSFVVFEVAQGQPAFFLLLLLAFFGRWLSITRRRRRSRRVGHGSGRRVLVFLRSGSGFFGL